MGMLNGLPDSRSDVGLALCLHADSLRAMWSSECIWVHGKCPG
jgi:hypothetical protein